MTTTTDSWKSWAELREVDEWLLSMAGIFEQGWDKKSVLPFQSMKIMTELAQRRATTSSKAI
jgi:hypothetical protein